MIIVGIVINYKFILNLIMPTKKDKDETITIHEGGKQLFYIGGYDYMDYSD
jgi:hypothetical protein